MPRARKRPSTAAEGADSAAGAAVPAKQPRRPADDAAAAAGVEKSLPPLFPLPLRDPSWLRGLPRPDAGTVKSLEAAYGGVAFPDELLQVYEFCAEFCEGNACGNGADKLSPVQAFKSALAPLGLEPCGPFDFLLCSGAETPGGAGAGSSFDWLTHCRYAHDPPEFLTLFAASDGPGGDGRVSELHLGYVRDSPELPPAFLAANDSAKGGAFNRMGETICQSLILHARRRESSLSDGQRQRQRGLLARLSDFCRRRRLPDPEAAASAAESPALKRRDKAAVARTLNRLGLCVPLSGEVGYRELPEADGDLRRMLTRVAARCDAETGDRQARLVLLEPVDELVTLVQFANDEGDPGMGLELGLDLLSVPSETGCYDDLIEGLLVTGYGLVGRRLHGDIVRRHMAVRRRYRGVGAATD